MSDHSTTRKTPTERQRYDIECHSRNLGPDVVSEIAYGAPKHVKRGRPPFWSSPPVKELQELALRITKKKYFSGGPNAVDALLKLASMLRDPDGGLPSIALTKNTKLKKIAKRIGSQNKDTIARQIRRHTKRT